MKCYAPQATKHLCLSRLVEPMEEAILGPFVMIQFGDFRITNSNLGYNSNDARACIKSFQFGKSVGNGTGFKVEIITEEYKTMMQIIKILNTSKTKAAEDAHKASCEFGWIKRSCMNTIRFISNAQYGGKLIFLVQTIESNFENGVYKINVECCDLFQRTNQQTQGLNEFGEDDNKMTLKEALRKIWTDPKFHPNVDRIEFKTFDNKEKAGSGPQYSFRNSDGGSNGPYSTFQTKEKNKLSTTREWINAVLTDSDKGIMQQFDNEDKWTLNFQEDLFDDNVSKCEKSLGSFVVNGGNCSPVISFNPKINWLTQNTGNGAVDGGAKSVDGTRANNEKFMNPKWDKIEQVGGNQTETPAYDHNHWRPAKTQSFSLQKSAEEHSHATKSYEIAGAIEAELTIQGNPKFSYNFGDGGIVGAFVSIAVLNPAVIREKQSLDKTECVWLEESPVNEVLSNSGWLVKGVDHQISDGKYVTTFKLTLQAPNDVLNYNDTLGGTDDGYKLFENFKPIDLGDVP